LLIEISKLKVRFLPRSPNFNNLGASARCLRAVCEGKAGDLRERLTFLIGDYVSVNIHGRSDIGVTHAERLTVTILVVYIR
jgi:hypothetical protein